LITLRANSKDITALLDFAHDKFGVDITAAENAISGATNVAISIKGTFQTKAGVPVTLDIEINDTNPTTAVSA